MLSKWIGNTVGKGEIARYEQFLLFPQCFQKACFPGASKGVFVWEWVKELVINQTTKSDLSKFADSRVGSLGNRENTGQYIKILVN